MSRSFGASVALRIAVLASVATCSVAASAQERDPAVAEALYRDAQALMAKGNVAEACAKFHESNRLDPALATQFQLGNCYEQTGRIATAWAAFLQVASTARATNQAAREKVARERAEALQARLPQLLINVPEASKVPGLEIRRNGMLVGAAQWGTAVPVNPGEVELTASAPGKQTLRQTLRVEEGKTANYSLPTLVQGEGAGAAPPTPAPTAAPAPAPAVAAPSAPPASAPPPAEPAAKSGNGPWIITLAGAGVVGLGLGGAFALMAKGKYDDSKNDCDLDDVNACGPIGMDLRNDARTKGDIATVSVIVGGAALAGAGIVWLASGKSGEKSAASATRLKAAPAIGPNLAALFVQGRF